VGQVGIQHLELLSQLGITEPAVEPRMVARKIIDLGNLGENASENQT